MSNITNKDCERKVEKQVKLFDERCSGLYVSVSPKGAMFNLKYFDRVLRAQRTVEVGLYVKDKFTVVEARIKADGFRIRAAQGESLVATLCQAATEKRQAGTPVSQVIDDYIAYIKEPVNKPDGEKRARKETWAEIEGYLNRSARVRFGDRAASEITNRDISALQKAIVKGEYGKPSVSNARNTRAAISGMFRWAAEADQPYGVNASPCVNLPKLDKEIERKRVLSVDEIKTLWWGLDRPDLPCEREIALGLKFELVTMLRSKEFLRAERHEFVGLGTPTARLHVPLKRVKKRRDLIVPLSLLAQEIVAEALTLRDGKQPYVFPGRSSGKPLDSKALGHAARGYTDKNGKVVRQGICEFLGMQPWTPHDLRRTAASVARGLGIPKWKISQCLDHRSRDEEEAPVVTDVYVHSEYDGEKKEVLDAVARALREIIGLPPATQQPAQKLKLVG